MQSSPEPTELIWISGATLFNIFSATFKLTSLSSTISILPRATDVDAALAEDYSLLFGDSKGIVTETQVPPPGLSSNAICPANIWLI